MKFSHVVPQISSQTDQHISTDRQTDRQTFSSQYCTPLLECSK